MSLPSVAADTKSVEVVTADLDLASDAGRKTLDRRLSGAVRQICGGLTAATDRNFRSSYNQCVVETRSNYDQQVRVAIANDSAPRMAAGQSSDAVSAR